MKSVMAPPAPRQGESPFAVKSGVEDRRVPRLIAWQGLSMRVPENWDLTGFSGRDEAGYLRIDDGEDQALEVKWATEPKKAKTAPNVEVRRESYFRSLKKTAKQKKLDLETREADAPRAARNRPEWSTAGFTWLGDRKAIGFVWHCTICRRVVIAQVLGARSGKGGLSAVAESALGSLRCHGDDPKWRTWALYDLITEVPSEYVLESQQLMNVYLRLTFAYKTTTRLSVEQWSLANVARRDAYLDVWLAANSRSVIREARYAAEEGEPVNGHDALRLSGGPAFGLPMINVARQVSRLHRPATRFGGVAWECEPTNKVFAVQTLRPPKVPDRTEEVARRTRCHDESGDAA